MRFRAKEAEKELVEARKSYGTALAKERDRVKRLVEELKWVAENALEISARQTIVNRVNDALAAIEAHRTTGQENIAIDGDGVDHSKAHHPWTDSATEEGK